MQEEKPESDIDILADFSENKSLLTVVRIEKLSEIFEVKVDLLTVESISSYLMTGSKRSKSDIDIKIQDYN